MLDIKSISTNYVFNRQGASIIIAVLEQEVTERRTVIGFEVAQ